jgi:WD repeat-containing protein 48
MTELRNPEKFTVICEEKSPILKMVMTPDQSNIWIATSDSTINSWVINLSFSLKIVKSIMSSL